MDENTKKKLALNDLERAAKNLKAVGVLSEEDLTLPEYAKHIGFHQAAEDELQRAYHFSKPKFEENHDLLKKIISKKNLSPQELKENMAAALRLSLGPELNQPNIPEHEKINIGKTSPARSDKYYPLLDSVPVDKDRRLTVRTDPMGNIIYSAERIPNDKEAFKKLNTLIDKYKITDPSMLDYYTKEALKPEEIAYLKVNPTGHVNFISSGKKGIAEGVMPRLLMEATSRGQIPHSSNLLIPGQKFVGRMAKEFNTPEFMNVIKKFIDTGKVGTLWSAVPTIGAIGAAKLGAGLATGGLSKLAEAMSDSEDINENHPSEIHLMKMDRDIEEAKKKNPELYRELEQNMEKFSPEDLIDPNAQKLMFRKLRSKLR